MTKFNLNDYMYIQITEMAETIDNKNYMLRTQESLTNACPDYDSDCNDMNAMEANWCFMGCQNHPCNPSPNNSLGIAKGECPIIHKLN